MGIREVGSLCRKDKMKLICLFRGKKKEVSTVSWFFFSGGRVVEKKGKFGKPLWKKELL